MKTVTSLIFAALVATTSAGPLVTVVDKKNRSLFAELIALTDKEVTVKRASDDKTFTLPLASLTPETVERLKEKADKLPVVYPKLEVNVAIGNRRVKQSGSFYMKSQNISTTISIRNLDLEKDFPKRPGRVVYFGQDQSNPDRFKILAINGFEVAPGANKTAEAVLPTFSTSYDSDNIGFGNIGGYEYEGYLFLVWDENKDVIVHKTTSGTVARAIKIDYGLLARMVTAKNGTILGKNLSSLSAKKPTGDTKKPIIVQ